MLPFQVVPYIHGRTVFLADIRVLAANAGAGGMAPPASTRISARFESCSGTQFTREYSTRIEIWRGVWIQAAVVLRVDSPGGDALASELIWRARPHPAYTATLTIRLQLNPDFARGFSRSKSLIHAHVRKYKRF